MDANCSWALGSCCLRSWSHLRKQQMQNTTTITLIINRRNRKKTETVLRLWMTVSKMRPKIHQNVLMQMVVFFPFARVQQIHIDFNLIWNKYFAYDWHWCCHVRACGGSIEGKKNGTHRYNNHHQFIYLDEWVISDKTHYNIVINFPFWRINATNSERHIQNIRFSCSLVFFSVDWKFTAKCQANYSYNWFSIHQQRAAVSNTAIWYLVAMQMVRNSPNNENVANVELTKRQQYV